MRDFQQQRDYAVGAMCVFIIDLSSSQVLHLFHSLTREGMRSPYLPARSVLFRKEPNGVTYRVPALLYLSASRSFLAFCEERLSPSDSQAHLLVLRRGSFYRNYVEVRRLHSRLTCTSTAEVQVFLLYCLPQYSSLPVSASVG